MASRSESCPRCGGHVVEMSSPTSIHCTSSPCVAYWNSLKDFQGEIIARDLAGTRAKTTPEILGLSDDVGLKAQLQELVELVKKNTRKDVYQELHKAIGLAIAGRSTDTPQGIIEIDILSEMQKWVGKQKDD